MIRCIAVTLFVLCWLSANAEVEIDIEYSSVTEARAALENHPDAEFDPDRTWQDWTTVTVDTDEAYVIWVFPPPDSPVYPAVAKQQLFVTEESMDMGLSVLCEVPGPYCDQFRAEMIEFTNNIVESHRDGN